MQALYLLLLIAAANTVPLLLKRVLGAKLAYPLDGGLTLWDGQPLFGRAKTVRGAAVAIALPLLLAPLTSHAVGEGAAIGAMAMVGDLASSFVKRRLKMQPSSQAIGLDHIPEVLLPAWIARTWFGLGAVEVVLLVVVFVVGALVGSRLFYRLGLRERPY